MLDIADLLGLTIPLIAGILLGYVLREKWCINLSKVTFGVIITLIFSLGFSIGSNTELLHSTQKVGVNAFVILLLSIFFSMVFAEVAIKMVKMA